MDILTLDYETFYDIGYSLNKLSIVEYVQAPEFLVWGLGTKWNNEPAEWFSKDEVKEIFTQINWSSTAVVCHNALFDAYILTQKYNVYPTYYYDTAAMSRGLYPNESASLKNVSIRIFPDDKNMRKGEDLVKVKGIQDLNPELESILAKYCIQDVDLTYAIFNKMSFAFPKSELDLIDMTIRMFVEPKLLLNRELLISYKNQLIIETAQKIKDSGITREILASQIKFASHIESLGITVPTKKSPRTGKIIPAFSKNDSAYIQMCNAYPEHKHIWEAREVVKSRIEETRAERFLSSINPDGTFSVPLRYYAAHTGRFGGAEKINLQNLPRGSQLRNAITAPDNQVLYIVDLANIEARMLAWLSKEYNLLEAFEKGEDIYSQFASQIYGRPITKINKLERYVGKTAILGLGYGMGSTRYKDTLRHGSPSVDVTDETSLKIVSQYRAMYPNIPRLWNVCKQFLYGMMDHAQYGNKYGPLAVSNNAIRLPNSMFLKYPHLTYTNGEFVYISSFNKRLIRTHGPRVCENIIQALARIIITDHMLAIKNNIPEVNVVLTVHDEIICTGPDQNSNEILDKLIVIMTTAPEWCKELPLAVEGNYNKIYIK